MNESLNEIHKKLRGRLLRPLIFYLPRKFWLKLDRVKWADKTFDKIFDTVVLMNEDGINQELNNDPSYIYILSKSVALDKNSYQLHDMQSKLNKRSFDFLMNNYLKQLNFYRKISNWMLDNVREDIKTLSKETYQSFEFQKLSFEKHWKYVQENLKPLPKTHKFQLDSKLTKKDINTINGFMEPTLETFQHDSNSGYKKTKNLKKKKILVTEEEAEQFLLQTIFNIKK